MCQPVAMIVHLKILTTRQELCVCMYVHTHMSINHSIENITYHQWVIF